MKNYSQPYEGQLRGYNLRVPEIIRKVPGIFIFGRRIKSLAFTTDISIIRNIDADAILAVYPFTPQPIITQCVLNASDVPVFAGIGGGLTTGKRVINLAIDTEFRGATGVVVNAPTPNETIRLLSETVDIPIVVTVVSQEEDIDARIQAGADMFNVSGAANTPHIVEMIKKKYPKIPVIATGGSTDERILATIDAGADAITYTPPTNGEIFKHKMDLYRQTLSGQQ